MSDERDSGRDAARDAERNAERDAARDPDTESFDADEWFRTQFGGAAPAPAPAESVVPVAPTTPVGPPEVIEPPELVEPPEPEEHLELEPTQPSSIIETGALPLGDAATELLREPEEGGALDELFSTDSFQEYNEALIPVTPRQRGGRAGARGGDASGGTASGTAVGAGAAGAGVPPVDGAPRRPPLNRAQKILIWVAGALVALLALTAVFFGGTRIPMLLGPAPGAEPSPTPTPTPTPTLVERPVGPVEPGDYAWGELGGGECLEPFVDAWQEEFTVVDCAEPHTGQLVLRAPFALAEGATEQGPYPGEEALAAQMSLLCSAPGALDLAVAGALSDLQVQGAYPVSAEAWEDGEQDYFCFVSRSTGEPLTGSLAIPPPPPTE